MSERTRSVQARAAVQRTSSPTQARTREHGTDASTRIPTRNHTTSYKDKGPDGKGFQPKGGQPVMALAEVLGRLRNDHPDRNVKAHAGVNGTASGGGEGVVGWCDQGGCGGQGAAGGRALERTGGGRAILQTAFGAEAHRPFAKVDEVLPGSPAAEAGIKAGDLITHFGRLTASNDKDLLAMTHVVQSNIGHMIAVIVKRDNEVGRGAGAGVACVQEPLTPSDVCMADPTTLALDP